MYTVHIPVYNQDSMYIIHTSPGSLQYSKERGEREYTLIMFNFFCIVQLVQQSLQPNIQTMNSFSLKLQRFTLSYFKDTGIPTKDETSETTVWNSYCLFPYIHDSLQL